MLRHDQMPPIPSEPRPLPPGPLYFVGVGGAGMSGLAQIFAERGRNVSGGDPGITPVVRERLEKAGVRVFAGHDASQLPEGVGAVVVSDAVPETNPEVMAAQALNVPIFRRPEVLADLVNAGRGIAIAGTHGKTTTTGMVASILLAADLDPTIILGGDLPAIGGNARNGKSDIVLAESCEAYDGFLYLHPEIAVVLNIEADHLDYHLTEQHVFDSFERFMRQTTEHKPAKGPKNWFKRLADPDRGTGTIITLGDDSRLQEIAMRVAPHFAEKDGHFSFGEESDNEDSQNTFFPIDIDLSGPGASYTWMTDDDDGAMPLGHVQLAVPGLHNVLNSLAAAAVGWAMGISPEKIIAGLEAFTGTGRRFEKLGEKNGVLVVDDYAHHPTELRATLSAARSAYPTRRIVAVFQPHLPSRTRDNMDAFADALALADVAYLTDIYLARESALPGVTSEILAARVREAKPDSQVEYLPNKADLPAHLVESVKPGDLVLTLGAGDIRAAGEGLLKLL